MRMIDDAEYAAMVHECRDSEGALTTYAERAYELGPLMTHRFLCEKTGLPITTFWFEIECPEGKISLSSCIEECTHLDITQKRDYVMKECFALDYSLAMRLGLGRPESEIRWEAVQRGQEEYREIIARRERGDPEPTSPLG